MFFSISLKYKKSVTNVIYLLLVALVAQFVVTQGLFWSAIDNSVNVIQFATWRCKSVNTTKARTATIL